MARIFLARTEEQKRFREVLRSLQPNVGWLSKNLPTVAKLLPAKKETVSTSPHIFLLYGEGGMGKTSLGRRFCELAGEEFPDRFQVLRIDWEEAKKAYQSLKGVAHEAIRPESVLETIYLVVSEKREMDFEKYQQVEKTLKQIEEKVDKELQASKGEGAEYAPILKKGLIWSLGALRKLPEAELLLGAEDSKVDEAIADGTVSALVSLMKKRLSLEERRIFATPHRQLAEALGHGLQAISAQKPLVLLLDTYEIVDRLECDQVLRMVIKAAGQGVVWVIADRANLADSYRLSQDYFRGYRDEFSENLYVYPMSEFSRDQVSEYFAHPEIDVPLSDDEAEQVKQFSLGIPFVVKQIAAMRKRGIDLAKILSKCSTDSDDASSRERLITETIERFLRYCLDERDTKAVYAMAMMRRPDNELLKAMLGVEDLERDMRLLKARHSFVLLEGKGIRLHDKLKSFLQDHLRSGLAGQSIMVGELSVRAMAYLGTRLSEWTQEFTDTADYFESDRIANGLLDLVQHKFWQDVEIGWRYAVPLFMESWQYNLHWQKQLLEIVESFRVRFGGDGIKRLQIFTKILGYSSSDFDSRKNLLDELEELAQRGFLSSDDKNGYTVILTILHGHLLYEQQMYAEALQKYQEIANCLKETDLQLRKDLAKNLENIGSQLGWKNDSAIDSPKAKIAYEYSVKLYPKDSNALNRLGFSYYKSGQYELAIKYYQQAIIISPKKADLHINLGDTYKAYNKYELAIKSYEKAIQHEPKNFNTLNILGDICKVQGKYEPAIYYYKLALDIKPQYAHIHYNLGSIYKEQNEKELAITCFNKAINIDKENYTYYIDLANIYKSQVRYKSAIEFFKKAKGINSKIDESKFYSDIPILCKLFGICEEKESSKT